jgi:hypothetical protein
MNKHGGLCYTAGIKAITLNGTPQKISEFDMVAPSAGVLPRREFGNILVKVPGVYMVQGTVMLDSVSANFDTVVAEVYRNGIATRFKGRGNLASQSGSILSVGQGVLSSYFDRNSRFLSQQIHGALTPLATAQALSSGSPINVTKGSGKLIIMVNAGIDLVGSITVTGTSVNRNTGAETPADSEVITLDGVSTDSSSTDAESNTIYALANGYTTSKWYRGLVAVSTTDLDLSDVDVYHCSFEQFNDTGTVTLNTLDFNGEPTNAAAWLYAYLYSVDVTGSRVNVVNRASTEIPSAKTVADVPYRYRIGNIEHELDAATDGIFLDLIPGPNNQSYWDDVGTKIWFSRANTVSPDTSATIALNIPFMGLIDLDRNDYIELFVYTEGGATLAATINTVNFLLFSK